MSSAFDRQVRPIYDALDSGSNKPAIIACTKLLKKYPKSTLLMALKALGLVRLQKVEESMMLCDEVLATKTTDDSTLSIMTHVLRGLGRFTDMIAMFDDAFKRQPHNEELGAQTFFANIRTTNWKAAQQVANKMHKQFQEDRYLYWNILAVILQANDSTTPPNMRNLLYKLAHRHVLSSPTPSYLSADRFHLHLIILQELQLFDEAHTLLESEVGKAICSTSLVCNHTRRDIWRLRGLWEEEGERAQRNITERRDRNWLEFLSVLDATFSTVSSPHQQEVTEAVKSECIECISKARQFFTEIAEGDGRKDRSGFLALLELEKRSITNGLVSDQTELLTLMKRYYNTFGDKACCFEDTRPYLELPDDSLSAWTSFLESQTVSYVDVSELQRCINIRKLTRYNLPESQLSPESESTRAVEYLSDYLEGLHLGNSLPVTELQPVDDLAILAGQAFVNSWKTSGDVKYLFSAALVLEFALTKSRLSFPIRLLLVRIYRLLGASSLAIEHYRAMHVKQVQNDTLSHFILSRASTFSSAATGDLTYPTECIEASQIYISNTQETAEFITRAFSAEKYTQIPDFMTFEDRLENSLQRDLVKVEHVRMRISHEHLEPNLIDSELVELKFVFDRVHHDNRDFEILPNYQPRSQPSYNEQTLLFGSSPSYGWLGLFLKVYIRAFQQASDLDESVEEKLLVGDRPIKPSDLEKISLKERLAERKPEEYNELTSDERLFVDWATILGDWLEPYHDHTRPPPAVVLAEAAKQTEKAYPLKGHVTPPVSDSASNGHSKKEEEAPAVKKAPEAVANFFDEMTQRFKSLVESQSPPSEILHVAALTQEAFLVFTMGTLRFRSAPLVKIHKLGALVQMFNEIRTKAICVLRDMQSHLAQVSEGENTVESRKQFLDLPVSSKLDHDFVINIAKKIRESRKKTLEGAGKGMLKICSTYEHA
ncbi:hypothetical protein SERLA73DRAFT_172175 [Serpula lacrymans var. lacrymans S7.3]|uniref:Actin cytoskeleton organization protein n=2 Tax=Serpula lacrymans var. lacrymans TaxID=341189 RepID=F8QEK0_SERL3|nr:uncharacterized protein SERLADRAFT_454227 [Serpula lacrymans var. lacrymans S7.9]EGN93256.1 hypothetical protein SERLA73DRAFT_172175 [Serpula lacrymans var. lacrymans S7.3]EGO18640.1 hypothetical protein SERLADRAFT_454227 [Serpula lacrymans var. lacrymans S7.9]